MFVSRIQYLFWKVVIGYFSPKFPNLIVINDWHLAVVEAIVVSKLYSWPISQTKSNMAERIEFRTHSTIRIGYQIAQWPISTSNTSRKWCHILVIYISIEMLYFFGNSIQILHYIDHSFISMMNAILLIFYIYIYFDLYNSVCMYI